MTSAMQSVLAAMSDGFRRERPLPVSEWADAHRYLSEIASSEPGRWRTSRTPYLREIMDSLSPANPARRVVVMAGAQLGKTETGNNWLGSIIHQTPGPVLVVEPTLDTVKKVSQQRITPMIDATPVLRERVSEARSRDSSNTIAVKTFKGGLLIMTGANSAAGLRSMPIRFLFCDEVDEYPGDVEGQGDPVALAEKRTATFARRKVLMTSTPTIRGVSRIEREYLASDRRKFFVPCPECGHMDFLQWSRGGWRGDEGAHHHMVWEGHDLASVRMACSACGCLVPESAKATMLAGGQWRSTLPDGETWDGKTIGYHISSLYSPLGWKSWGDCLGEFLDAKDDPFRLKTWVNTVLGETFEEAGDALESGSLKARCEVYPADVPAGVGTLVCAVDTQVDRIEAQVVGFGAGEEMWLIAFEQMFADASQGDAWDSATGSIWAQLDRFLAQTFRHENGRACRIETTVIDSGGAHTEEVYRYCAARPGRRIIPIKGGSFDGRPLVERPSTRNRYHLPLYVLCVSTGKDMLMGRLQVKSRGPGFVHLPSWIDDEYAAQLTSERAVRKYVKGRGSVRVWEQTRERNEAFDLGVYSLAALHICGRAFVNGLAARARRWAAPTGDAAPVEEPSPPPEAAEPTPPARPARSVAKPRAKPWATRW